MRNPDVYRASIEYVGWAYRYWEALKGHRNAQAKAFLDRIIAMLTKLGQRGDTVREERGEYSVNPVDPDTDTDTDADA